jgi:transposase-like protein
MALPQTVRVKLSSEEAGAISLTPVVVQELAVRDLVEHMLGVTGKDEPRIRELLKRGTLVSGASRFRWTGWEADAESVRALLASFPDPEPSRPFNPERCVRAVLRGGGRVCEIPREVGARKGLLQRTSFWDHLMEQVSAESATTYAGYSYKDKADRYVRDLSAADAQRLRTASDAVKYSTVRDQLRQGAFTQVELFVTR